MMICKLQTRKHRLTQSQGLLKTNDIPNSKSTLLEWKKYIEA